MPDNTTPEIRDCDITSLVLTLKIHGHDDVLNFPFLDRPRRESVVRSLEVLFLLGALDREGRPTALGIEMNLLPLSPELGKVLLTAMRGDESSCVAEVIDIIACVSASSASSNAIFMTSSAEKREESAENRKHFVSRYGDHITLLQAFREYLSMVKLGTGIKDWCNKWGINRRVMKNVVVLPFFGLRSDDKETQKQLISYCTRNEIAVNPAQNPDKDAILQAFLSGYIMNTAFLQLDGSYRTCFSHHVSPLQAYLTLDRRHPSNERIISTRQSKKNRSNHVPRTGIPPLSSQSDDRFKHQRIMCVV
jgi:ATP-dependent RNA helicase DHR2